MHPGSLRYSSLDSSSILPRRAFYEARQAGISGFLFSALIPLAFSVGAAVSINKEATASAVFRKIRGPVFRGVSQLGRSNHLLSVLARARGTECCIRLIGVLKDR